MYAMPDTQRADVGESHGQGLGYLLWKPKDESDITNMHEQNFWAIGEEAELVRKQVNEADCQRMRAF